MPDVEEIMDDVGLEILTAVALEQELHALDPQSSDYLADLYYVITHAMLTEKESLDPNKGTMVAAMQAWVHNRSAGVLSEEELVTIGTALIDVVDFDDTHKIDAWFALCNLLKLGNDGDVDAAASTMILNLPYQAWKNMLGFFLAIPAARFSNTIQMGKDKCRQCYQAISKAVVDRLTNEPTNPYFVTWILSSAWSQQQERFERTCLIS